jgi:hypothetical protein
MNRHRRHGLTQDEMIARLPRAFRPRLDSTQVRDLALALLTKISTAAHAAAAVKESLTAAGVNAAAWSQV